MTKKVTLAQEDKERLEWGRKNIPIKDLFTYFYAGSGNKSLDNFQGYIDAKKGPPVGDQ